MRYLPLPKGISHSSWMRFPSLVRNRSGWNASGSFQWLPLWSSCRANRMKVPWGQVQHFGKKKDFYFWICFSCSKISNCGHTNKITWYFDIKWVMLFTYLSKFQMDIFDFYLVLIKSVIVIVQHKYFFVNRYCNYLFI